MERVRYHTHLETPFLSALAVLSFCLKVSVTTTRYVLPDKMLEFRTWLAMPN